MNPLSNSMIKKTLLVALLCLVYACGTKKPVIQTTKNPEPKPQREVVRTVKKPTDYESTSGPIEIPKTETLEATSKVKVTTEVVLKYIDTYKNVAMDNMRNHNVPASIALAQAILESGAGTGDLCRQANNHFGIKCHKEWKGESVRHDDDAAQECFRKYKKAYDSYQDYADFLKTRKWYNPLFKLKIDDYKGWARGLKAAGYATDPAYPSKLIGIIERYQLQKYDALVLGTDYVAPEPVIKEVIPQKPSSNKDLYEVVKGDTLYSISKRFSISIDELKRKNNIKEDSISLGQLLEVK